MKAKLSLRRIIATIIVTAMSIALIPKITGTGTVLAAEEITKNQSNTSLGVSGINKPTSGDTTSAWTGSYVYFGKYGVNPIKFRVLAPSTTAYGGSTMFLDSDTTLFNKSFDSSSNIWYDETTGQSCELRDYLNGDFINSDNGYFTDPEVSAIATSTGIGGDYSYADPSFGATFYGAPVSVNDKIFLLDATEVMNPDYGYSSDCGWYTASDWTWNAYFYDEWSSHGVTNHRKGGSSACWWLRSADSYFSDCAGYEYDGSLYTELVINDSIGVAPALNIDQSSIIFSTKIKDLVNNYGEYKLTIMDENLNIVVPAGQYVTATGTTITVPYAISGKDVGTATRATILITKGVWNESGATIILYDELGASTASSGTFTLPSECNLSGWGTDYHVYILAENINDVKVTDYASTPVEIALTQTCTVTYKVANGTWSDGTTADLTETVVEGALPASIPEGMLASSGYEGGEWDTDPSTATITGTITFTYTFEAIPTYTVTVQNDGNGTATADVTSGPEGTEVTLTATPSSGYLFKEWQVISGGVTVTDNKFTIGTSDVTVKAVFEAKPADPVEPTSVEPVNPTTVDPVTPAEPATVEPPKSTGPFTYTVVGGGDSTWTEGDPDLVVKVTSDEDGDHSFDRYEYTAIDGTKLTDEQAPATSGSTVITIKSDLLKTLSEGKHTILVNFSDNSITTTVTIVKKAAGTSNVPSTGEVIGASAIAGTVLIVSACSILIVMRTKKREDEL